MKDTNDRLYMLLFDYELEIAKEYLKGHPGKYPAKLVERIYAMADRQHELYTDLESLVDELDDTYDLNRENDR